MFNLLATILLNTLLFVIFKFFPRFKINAKQAIAINYWTCAATGYFLLEDKSAMFAQEYNGIIPWAILMGIMFIVVFNLMALSTVRDGITATTVANKLSLVIPVIFSVILYKEQLSPLQIAGILIAFPAVYLSTRTQKDEVKNGSLLLPAIIFISSGLLDTMVKYIEQYYLQTTNATIIYTIFMFFIAALTGSIAVIFSAIKNKTGFAMRNVVAGILLGIPNYFSIYFLVKLLNSHYFQSSAAIPLNNIGIVLLSAITGIFLFKEKTTRTRIIGLILSILAIILIAFADLNGRSI
jgi:drug/metabolite transporter (DMT)-like permease